MTDPQKTLVLVKPDGVSEGHVGKIISRFERKHFAITALKIVNATAAQLRKHYVEQVSKPYYSEIEAYMQEGPIVAMVVAGTDVVQMVHNMAGNTNPSEASPGTIRGDFAHQFVDGVLRNIVHTSDSLKNANKEIQIWFPDDQ